MRKYPSVSIIILNWNGKKLLKDCLSSLFKLTDYPNYKVIVVDNGSTDGSVEYVKKHFPKADILALDKNYGFSKGNNEGIKYALKKYNPDYILLLNNDTEIIQKDWLTRMVEVAESDKKIGIVGCKLVYPDGRIQHAGVDVFSLTHYGWGEEDKGQWDEIKEVLAISGACFFIKRSLIKKIGLLDEIYSPYWGEETDFCMRAIRAGFKIVYVGHSTLIHREGFSIKKVSDIKRFLITQRNELTFFLRYFPFSFFLKSILKGFVRVFLSYKVGGMRKAGLIFHKNFIKRFIALVKAIKLSIINYRLTIGDRNSKNTCVPYCQE